jgi:hypothetical protein
LHLPLAPASSSRRQLVAKLPETEFGSVCSGTLVSKIQAQKTHKYLRGLDFNEKILLTGPENEVSQ